MSCAPSNSSALSDKFGSEDSQESTSSPENNDADSTTDSNISLPDYIKFPQKLWNTTYYFSKDNNPDFCLIMEFGVPMDRYSTSLKATEYPGYIHNYENYYYGTYEYEGDILHFDFTNPKDEVMVKFTWTGTDIICDYFFSNDFEWELPATGVKIVEE